MFNAGPVAIAAPLRQISGMPDAFVSLNSWHQPGAILQAEEPVEMIAGGPDATTVP